MNARHLPTELACLARQMLSTAENLTLQASELPGAWHACNQWATDKPLPPAMAQLMHSMLADARTLEFAAQGLSAQVDKADDRARTLYAMTMDLVDGIRLARTQTRLKDFRQEKTNNPELVQLADFCEAKVADLQERLAEQFPGERIPGG